MELCGEGNNNTMDVVLRTIQSLIVRGEEIAAKAQLLEYLDVHPTSADGWWLVSLLADNDDDTQAALKQSLKYDSTHYEAKKALQKIAQKAKIAQASPSSASINSQTEVKEKNKTSTKNAPDQPPPILSAAISYYVKNGWQIKKFNPEQVTIEKTTGLAWGFAFIIAALIPVLGWIVFLGNLFVRRRHEIKLTYLPLNQRVQILGRSVPDIQVDWNGIRRGHLPTPQTNYIGALIGGLVIMIGVCGAFIGFVVLFGSDAPEFDEGEIAYIDHGVTDNCHQVYRTASFTNPYTNKYPNGYQVIVQIVDNSDVNDVWYLVTSIDAEEIGWLPEDYLSPTRPSRSIPLNFCQ